MQGTRSWHAITSSWSSLRESAGRRSLEYVFGVGPEDSDARAAMLQRGYGTLLR